MTLGVDVARARAHPADTFAVVGEVDAEDLGVRANLERTHLLGALAHQGSRAERINNADGRKVQTLDDDRGVEIGHELCDALGAQHLTGNPPRLRGGHPSTQLLAARLGARNLNAAALDEDAELLVLRRRVGRELGHHLRVVDRKDEVGRVTRRAAGVGHRSLVDEDEITPTESRQVVRE